MSSSILNLTNSEIVEKYTPLVKYIASRIMVDRTKYMDMEDLIGYGYIGLIDAINKFDSSKGASFASYASIRIKGAILDEIRKTRIASRTVVSKLIKYNETVDKLQHKLLREPTTEEISIEMNISTKDVYEIENCINYMATLSLESLLYSDKSNESNFLTVLNDDSSKSQEEIAEEKERVEILAKCIGELEEKDRIILNLYYYENLTLKEIGQVLKISESRVCQIHSRAIRNLKVKLEKINYIG